ncbi:vac14, partial [Symbiodinium microadriaticum]
VIARICINEQQFQRVLNALVQLFFEDRPLLETRGALIIRKLCALLDCQKIYRSLASIMVKSDLEFCSTIVQTLNLILLTAPELSPLRKTLQDCVLQPQSDEDIFTILFKCWSHNPVATFSLCLLSQTYDLSADLVHKFAEVDVTVGFLMQIDKLVQLIESPVFIRLRLQLLDVDSTFHADLLKSLYGLLMLLPQSQAYKTLSDRLATVSSLKMHLAFNVPAACGVVSKSSPNGEARAAVDYSELLSHFQDIQSSHYEFRLSVFQQKKLTKTITAAEEK